MRYLVLFVLVSGFACSKSEPAAPPTGAAPGEAPASSTEPAEAEGQPEGSSAAAATKPSAEAPPPSIVLLSPGAEPLRVLRWMFKEGSKETMKIRTQVTMTAQMGVDGEKKTVTPPVAHTLALKVRSVDGDGSAVVGFKVMNSRLLAEPQARAQTREKMTNSVRSLRGLDGTYQVNAQGVVTDFQIAETARAERRDLPMAESLGPFLYRSTVPVPTEAVGKGARWTVERRLEEGGIIVDQTSTYELQKLDGSTIAVQVQTEKSAPKQEIGTPGTLSHYELKQYAATAEGEHRAHLGKLVPREAASKTRSEVKMFMQKKDGLALQRELTVEAQERMGR